MMINQKNIYISISLVFLLITNSVLAATKYASPTGSGTTCSTSTPCSVSTLVGQLTPGDTGLLKDGTYSGSGTVILLDGSSNVVDGTSAERITLRAENAGKVLILGNGTSGQVLRAVNLDWWIIENLRIENVTNSGYTGNDSQVVYFFNSNDNILRYNIVKNPNQYGNSGAINIQGNRNLIEENDVYRFHRNGIETFGTGASNNIIRGNYASQSLQDLSSGGDGPNDYFVAYDSPNNIWENNIAERSGTGSGDKNGFSAWAAGNEYYGNISIGHTNGITLVSAASVTTGANNYIIKDHVSINPTNYGVFLRSPINATVTNVTAHTSTTPDRGLLANNGDSVGTTSLVLRNLLVVDTSGVVTSPITTLTISHSHEWNGASSWSTGTSGRTDSPPTPPGDVDPQLGDCRVIIPAASPFKKVGFGGGDVGANVLLAYKNGVLTTRQLWDSSLSGVDRGKMLMGPPIVVGVNDTGIVRATVHQRIGFGTSGCVLPALPECNTTFRRRLVK